MQESGIRITLAPISASETYDDEDALSQEAFNLGTAEEEIRGKKSAHGVILTRGLCGAYSHCVLMTWDPSCSTVVFGRSS